MKSDKKLLIGAHVSIAGGMYHALLSGAKIGCTCIQIFTSSNRQWSSKSLDEEDVKAFIATKNETKITDVISHASYLINLASSDSRTKKLSQLTLTAELERCHKLNIKYTVVHPGSALKSPEDDAISYLAESLDAACAQAKNDVIVALENMAGQGSTLGHTFEQLAKIRAKVSFPNRIGFCFDTCHAFAGGYDFSTPENYHAMWQLFDNIIGLKHLKVIHLNDSKKDRASRIDRHENIGQGRIGIEAFRLLMNDEHLLYIPKILETPVKYSWITDHKKNLTTLIGLLSEKHKNLYEKCL